MLDVTEEPLLRAAIDWVAEGYARFYSPEPDAVHPMWEAPHTVEELRGRIEMLMQRDTTADAFGGWELITKMMSGGGMYAQRLVTRLHYDMEAAKALAREAAGIREEETAAHPRRGR